MSSPIPLAMLPEGSTGVVKGVVGGWGLVRRLAELGFTPGARVTVLKSSPPGPVLVVVRGARIALGRGIAMKILVDVSPY